MARIKRTAFLKPSLPYPALKRLRSVGGVKIASPPSSPPAPPRPSMGLLAPKVAPMLTAYNAILPILVQAEM
ncbi:hypothetical protein LIER_29936 [Lithospermum erythrorhizon]|uniref:Uncharacterized protein n=1 Tax=Lithospermum erythrorhizon TaxID=34254 RepID=A0AAV3RNT7_LITER